VPITNVSPSSSGDITSQAINDYQVARAGTGSLVLTASSLFVGQLYSEDFDSGDQFFDVIEAFLAFDTSGITGTVTAATLELWLTLDVSTADFTVRVYAYDFGTLSTADFVAGASLPPGGVALAASLNTSGIGATGSRKAFTSAGSVLAGAVNTAGTTRLLIVSSRQASGAAPSGNEFVQFDPAQSRLVVDASTGPVPITATMAATFGALTATATATVIHPATMAATFGGLTATAAATVEHPATLAGDWGALSAVAVAGVTPGEPPPPTPSAGGGGFIRYRPPRASQPAPLLPTVRPPARVPARAPALVPVIMTGSWGALTAVATATASRDPDADLIDLLLVGAI
jgi:hypothetical protein